jgi:hypothetical protein
MSDKDQSQLMKKVKLMKEAGLINQTQITTSASTTLDWWKNDVGQGWQLQGFLWPESDMF